METAGQEPPERWNHTALPSVHGDSPCTRNERRSGRPQRREAALVLNVHKPLRGREAMRSRYSYIPTKYQGRGGPRGVLLGLPHNSNRRYRCPYPPPATWKYLSSLVPRYVRNNVIGKRRTRARIYLVNRYRGTKGAVRKPHRGSIHAEKFIGYP